MFCMGSPELPKLLRTIAERNGFRKVDPKMSAEELGFASIRLYVPLVNIGVIRMRGDQIAPNEIDSAH
jgi:hypothetical protein